MLRFFPLPVSYLLLGLLWACTPAPFHNETYNSKPGKTPEFTEGKLLLGKLTAFRSCYDVHQYDLNVQFDPNTEQISGKVIISASAETTFDTLQIDLDHTFQIDQLTDAKSGNSLPYFRKERAVFVIFRCMQGNNFQLSVSYRGKPATAKKAPWLGGFVWKKDKEKNPWCGVACESDGASIWWPLKDHTSDEADSVSLHYTVPKGLTAVGNGQFIGKEIHDTTTTYHWKVSYPINSYNITVYIGDFKEISDVYTGIHGKQLQLSYFVLPKHVYQAKKHFAQVHQILSTYEQLYGEYAWYRDGYKLIESPFAGMEHQSAIAYGNGYRNDLYGNTDYIILHETAHEWWGNAITANDLADVWLQEGFATYSEALFFEKTKGKTYYEKHLLSMRGNIKNKYPVYGIPGTRWFHYRDNSDVYSKGAWMLHSLRTTLHNDSLFFDILRSFYNEYKRTTCTSEDFIRLVITKTQTDYRWFFQRYLYSAEIPELNYHISLKGRLYYRWSNTTTEEEKKLCVKVRSKNKILTLHPTRKTQSIALPDFKDKNWGIRFEGNILYTRSKYGPFASKLP